jgi:hypothetical protein
MRGVGAPARYAIGNDADITRLLAWVYFSPEPRRGIPNRPVYANRRERYPSGKRQNVDAKDEDMNPP